MHLLKKENRSGKENRLARLKFIYSIIYFTLFYFSFQNLYSQEAEKTDKNLIPKDSSVSDFNAEQIIERNKPALISIWYQTNSYSNGYSYELKDTTLLSGSGFIFEPSGFVGTNYHVVDGIDSLLIKTSDGKFYDAQLLLLDEKKDMAILKIKNPDNTVFPVVTFGNSDILKVGQDVFAIGSPLGYEYTISQGIIAGIRENEKVSFTDPVTYLPIEKQFEKVIQITAAISPGNSGGALFNRRGEVIGITTYTYTGYGNLNFALAINTFVKYKNSFELSNLASNEEAKKKIEESMYFSNLKLADNYKSEVTYNWTYVKQRDTMKTLDTFIVKQDSIAKMTFKKAENLYNKCILIKPDSFSVYQNLMDLYVFTENFNKAETLYTTIREKFQSDSLVSLLSSGLANAYSTSKEYKKALIFYEKMIKKDSNDLSLRFQVANLHEKMKKYNQAVKEYNKILKKDSTYTQAYIQLGIINYKKLKDYRKAKYYLTRADDRETITNGTTYYVDIPYYLGLIAIKEGKKMDAILYYMELKNIYTYSAEDNQKKLELLNAIRK